MNPAANGMSSVGIAGAIVILLNEWLIPTIGTTAMNSKAQEAFTILLTGFISLMLHWLSPHRPVAASPEATTGLLITQEQPQVRVQPVGPAVPPAAAAAATTLAGRPLPAGVAPRTA